jgi:hypothetical protein
VRYRQVVHSVRESLVRFFPFFTGVVMRPLPHSKYNLFSRRFYHSAFGYGLHQALDLVQSLSPTERKPMQLAIAYLDNRLDDEVRYGEFAGMNFKPARAQANQYHSKLLGVYERELAPIWRKLREETYDLILNVGAAEGYYSVGLALMQPRARVIAFEASEGFRNTLTSLAAANRVSITVHGFCDEPRLIDALEGAHRALVILDVEGFEFELLVPNSVHQLNSCDVLVETHEFVRISVVKEIIKRFSTTHEIRVIRARRRRLADLPFEAPSSLRLRVGLFQLIQEHRSYPQEWLWMQARRQTQHGLCGSSHTEPVMRLTQPP